MKLYYCCGEKYNDRIRQGLCGGFGEIQDFIQWLFGNVGNYFEGWKDREIIDYIKNNAGKRLKQCDSFVGCWSIKKELLK